MCQGVRPVSILLADEHFEIERTWLAQLIIARVDYAGGSQGYMSNETDSRIKGISSKSDPSTQS